LADLPPGDYPNAREFVLASDQSIWGIGVDGTTDFLYRMAGDGSGYQRINMMDPAIGTSPVALVELPDGYIYGAAKLGGSSNAGTIFRVRLDGTGLSHVVDFPGGQDGRLPTSHLILHSNGSLYGITEFIGGDGAVLYRINPDHSYKKMSSLIFQGVNLLTELNGGNLCLATSSTFMMCRPDGTYEESILFLYSNIGEEITSMLQTADGYILASFYSGGTTGYGSLIKVLPDGSQYEKLRDFNAVDGAGTSAILMQKAAQEITSFDDIPQKAFLDPPFALHATTSSGAPVLFTSSDTSVAVVDGYMVTIKGVGTTTIRAKIPANGNYRASAEVTKTLTVVPSDQQLTFGPIPTREYGDPDFRLVSSSTSKLPITFTSSNESVATVSGNVVSMVGAGTTTITATIEQDPNFLPEPPIQQTLTVSKANQSIQFDPLGARYVDAGPFELPVNNTSSLPITLSSGTTAVATITGTTLTPLTAGQTVINANAAGDANHEPATPVEQVATILKHEQALVFDPIPDQRIEQGTFEFFPPRSSFGLPVDLTSASGNVSLSGSVVTMNAAGRVTLKANQPGSNSVSPAAEVSRTFCILPSKPTVTIDTSNPGTPVLASSSSTGNEWMKNGVLISGANSQTYSPEESGNYSVQVNIEGCISPVSISVSAVVVGLQDEGLALAVYPNPAHEKLYINLPSSVGGTSVVELHDMLGRSIMKFTLAQEVAEVDILSLPAGFYLVKVTQNGRNSLVRILKQ
jgi:hypothetical protein